METLQLLVFASPCHPDRRILGVAVVSDTMLTKRKGGVKHMSSNVIADLLVQIQELRETVGELTKYIALLEVGQSAGSFDFFVHDLSSALPSHEKELLTLGTSIAYAARDALADIPNVTPEMALDIAQAFQDRAVREQQNTLAKYAPKPD